MISAEIVNAWYARYQAGESLSSIARSRGCSRSAMAGIFLCRGLTLRVVHKNHAYNPKNGRWLKKRRYTQAEINRMADGLDSIRIPDELRWYWRMWPMERRVAFIQRVRNRLNRPTDRPKGPFSSNVEPFEYGSAKAMALAYDGPSQKCGRKLKIQTQGVIYKDQLFYWNQIAYVPENYSRSKDRQGWPTLHRIVWMESRGPIPPGMTVIHLDDNKNNLDPSNLALRSKAQCAEINKTLGRARKMRAKTAQLLKFQQSEATDENSKLVKQFALNPTR